MRIKIWGCRGSLPTPGPGTVRYGGHTTCVEVRLKDGTLIVFDAGSGIRALGKTLMGEGSPRTIHLYVTHAHWDHLMGFPFFAPARREDFTIRVRGGPLARRSLKNDLEHQMQAPYFPVPFEALRAEFHFADTDPQDRILGPARIMPIPLNHPNGGYGFKVVENDRSLVFLTDNELGHDHGTGPSREELVDFCQGADLLIHDAQYTTEEYEVTCGWGHSTYDAAIDLALDAGAGTLCLFHHDPDHDDRFLDSALEDCRDRLQRIGSSLECIAAFDGLERSLL